jgi:hypothetical protein
MILTLTPSDTVLLAKLIFRQLVTEFPAFYKNPKVRYRVQRSHTLVPVLSQIQSNAPQPTS